MQVSVEKTSELSRKMTVTVPEEVVQEKVNARLKSLAREVKVDGFRPGKVPQKVVQKMYGARVKEEITGDLIQTNYIQALQGNDLRPAGMPHIEPIESEEGFTFSAVFEVYPEFTLDAVESIEVNRPVANVESSDIDAMVDKLKEQKKSWEASEQDAQQGVQVTITFSGTCEGENFTDGTVEDFQVELGSKRMIPGFEDQLIGLAVGAKKTFEVTFPEDYGNKKIAGKVAAFDVEVFKIETSTLPEIDEEFIKAYGIESGEVEAFRADVEKNMQRELAQGLKVRLKNSVMDALYDAVPVSLPAAMVDQEVESLMKPYYENAKKRNVDVNEIKPASADFEDQAKRRVALGLILAEIIQKNEIKADADKIRAVIDDMAQSYEDPEQVVNWYYGDKERLAEIEQMVLEDATVAWVLDKVKVTDEAISFSDVMEPATQK
ncbi:trigger factor [Bathymodiolus platifrons methanotrophic gill symbiont]|uniref:trigger factor n=1 Tax=Bathymodiolus platifrons methanotrophic gill symbiont TaxID=113268 RepID=UPI000B409307|nr:trigger factor [Bathymodiolus platifrons methanotrophic gill symbiont]GAW85936.1 trigger factor [Bathymodiolus platifrons methanotrophic gill symbiont]GFO75772.1 trigger factor [Bathymodiolus platifrons methanotrophic gill symbiont]